MAKWVIGNRIAGTLTPGNAEGMAEDRLNFKRVEDKKEV
jgi:hypothetical protein